MKNVVLIGFMGTGKTSVGRLLAGRLGRPFVDIDQKIERHARMTIAEMFATRGEEYFRRRERETVGRVARYRNTVIATGGGVVLDPGNMARLRTGGVIVCLTASVDTILERTGRSNARPLLDRTDRRELIARMLAERAPLYAGADYTVDTDGQTPRRTVDIIVDYLRQEGYLSG